MASNKNNSDGNFFQRIIFSLFGSSDPEYEKKRLLRVISKDLSKSKYKFFKHNGVEALPSMAKYFYELYKVLGPAQIMFQSMTNPNAIKIAVIDASLSEKQRQLSEQLTEETILSQAKTLSAKEVSDKAHNTLSSFLAEFDSDKIEHIDTLYNRINLFKALCGYDYYFFLKKFCSGLQERNFSAVPKFESISAEYVLDDLKDFIAIAWGIPTDNKWESCLKLFRDLKGIEPISLSVWTKVLARIKNLKESHTLEMIIQYASSDPSYTPTVELHEEHIVDAYLNKIKTQTELTIKQIERQQVNSKVDQLINQLFGTTAIVRLKGYTEQASQVFEKKGIGSFKYHQPLNCLKAFLLDYVKKDIREFSDLVMVRGTWTSQSLVTPSSESYNQLLSISDKITVFDESYLESAELGSKIKTILPKIERDRDSANIIKTLLRDANDQAADFLTSATQALVVFGKTVKNLVEDHDKPHPELLTNWKEIDHIADPPIKEQGAAVYKKIYLFVSLMQCFLKPSA